MLIILVLYQLISKPTRLTSTSSTIIDLIFTNVHGKHNSTGVIPISLSDHYLIFTSITLRKPKSVPKIVKFRDFSNLDLNSFTNDFHQSNISHIFNITDVTFALNHIL